MHINVAAWLAWIGDPPGRRVFSILGNNSKLSVISKNCARTDMDRKKPMEIMKLSILFSLISFVLNPAINAMLYMAK